jgi:hypothetical protein
MDYRNSMGAIGVGIGFALMFSIMNGLSTYVFKGRTISEATVDRIGGGVA